MPTFRRETSLDAPVARHLRRRRFDTLYREAPFHDYRIDIFGVSKRDGSCVAVELKLTKWQRAFEQALIYQLCSDFSYVAMPREFVRRVAVEDFRAFGVGLIAVSSRSCRVIVPAERSRVVQPAYRERLLNRLQERS